MTLDRQFCLLPECGDEPWALLHGLKASAGITLDLVDGVKTQVGEFALFGVAEQIFDRVEFRCTINDNCFQLKLYCNTGVWPLGAHVVTRVGRSESPDSSIKTMVDLRW